MDIILYGTVGSSYTKALKDFLKERGVSFVEKLIDQSEEIRNEFSLKSNGFLGVPYLVLNNNDQEEKILGFDKGRIEKVLSK